MIFIFRFQVQGGHTHVTVFAGKGTSSLGKCGDLVFRNEEFSFLKEGIKCTIGTAYGIGHDIEFIEETANDQAS